MERAAELLQDHNSGDDTAGAPVPA
jgi:hypothetical protein